MSRSAQRRFALVSQQAALWLACFALCTPLPSCGEVNGPHAGVATAGSSSGAGSDLNAGSNSGGVGDADEPRATGGNSSAGAPAGASDLGGATDAAAGAGAGEVASGGTSGTSSMGGQPTGGNDSTPTAGTSAGGNGSGSAGASSGGNSSSTSDKLRSGTTLCLHTQECDGLECRARPKDAYGVCLSACMNDSECLPDERCVSGWLDEPACLHRCRLPNDCAYQFDCYDVSGARDYTCLPLAWVR